MPDPTDRFTDLLTRLVRVPKEAIDEKDRQYKRSKRKPAKPRAIVPGTGKRREAG